MAIYSLTVNSTEPLESVLKSQFPWYQDYGEDLQYLFKSYVDRKEESNVLDYDDLLLFWHALLSDPVVGAKVRGRFDCVLVDEYQDTNYLQAEILSLLSPEGTGLTVVGDDDQSIYSFRAATVRNILDFPKQFPTARIIKLEQNYRSTQLILDATNAVITQAKERYPKKLWTERQGGGKPQLVFCDDEFEQSEFLVRKILQHREEGIELRDQAVLFRASNNANILEIELARHNIPFVKYGGRKFVEAAHVKDVMVFLRLVENNRDLVAGTRVLKLLPGIGPKTSRQLMAVLPHEVGDLQAWSTARVPRAAAGHWPKFVKLMRHLPRAQPLPAQINAITKFYRPLLEEIYENTEPRLRDLEQLELLSSRFPDRRTMLAEFALDPPQTTDAFAESSDAEDDCLVLSTIHSSKGLEWRAVYVMSASDGNIPSSRAIASPQQIEEERRLLYVAMTRAKDWLYLSFPQQYYHAYRGGGGNVNGHAQLTRFCSETVQAKFVKVAIVSDGEREDSESVAPGLIRVRDQVRAMWR